MIADKPLAGNIRQYLQLRCSWWQRWTD